MYNPKSFLLKGILLLLIASNVFWAYFYFTDEERDLNCLKEGATVLAIMLGHTGHILQELSRNRFTENLEFAYFNVDHAIIIAQALYYLTGTSEWKSLYSTVSSLHDLMSGMYQGVRASKEKLILVGEILKNLSGALKGLDIRGIQGIFKEVDNPNI